jgi:hypothetical protein
MSRITPPTEKFIMRSSLCAGVLLVCFAGCSHDSTWAPIAAEELSAAQLAQLAKAEQARDGLAKALMGELNAGLEQGTAHAITVCSERAPVLAAAKAREFGVRVGRTSLSLRNPTNAAPEWARQHVNSGAAFPTFFAGSAGDLAALFPIRLLPQCLQCHGKSDDLSAEVRAALAKQYPQDHAMGFAVGDLRGWFWVEVPVQR